MVLCWWRLSRRKQRKIMASENHSKKWFLRPPLLSGILLLLLGVIGGPMADWCFLPAAPGGIYWPRFLGSITSVLFGPLSFFIAYFTGMIELNLVGFISSFFIGVGIIGWWILCMKRNSFFFPIPVLFWAIIGAFWFVIFGLMAV